MAMIDDDLRPRREEIACGLAINVQPGGPQLPREAPPRLRVAVEDAVRVALLRPPCLVSFSGGRDSSAILATAVAVARREGLPLPIPVTQRFRGVATSHEDEWQERVVRHLGVEDWTRLELTSELDAIGPVATRVLRRHGVLWPFNAHFHAAMFERARGGSFLTGVGGDELLASQRWHWAQRVLAGHVRRRPRHALTLGLAFAPRPLRAAVLARRLAISWPWLHADVAGEINNRRARWEARTPVDWSAGVEWWWRSRTRRIRTGTLTLLADDAGTALVQPFLEPRVLAAACNEFGAAGPAKRTAAMESVFGDLLPGSVVSRRSKASFDLAFFSDYSRAFVESWSGNNVDTALVNADALAAVWHASAPDPRSLSLLQATWLASGTGNKTEGSTYGAGGSRADT